MHGRFLHITDVHPDPYYKTYSSTEADAACHRDKGPAGLYGAETSGCDTPLSLVNETFKWIETHLKDKIDFVIWTGDSARHDNDEEIPRTREQIIDQNEFLVTKFTEVFGSNKSNPTNAFTIPIVPTFGNNDIMPHNIFLSGPNRWTKKYIGIWHKFIPEEQRHQFERGGWFRVEVIPGRLAVISLNTIYFFASNSAVNGCGAKHEPGYEHMEWLRVQLQVLRERGMKVILMGHVPPARTENKLSWDETCWQKFTLWQRQYRDIIVAALFGHMNIDHFMLQDFHDLKQDTKKGRMKADINNQKGIRRENMLEDGEVTIMSAADYLLDLRETWANLPVPPKGSSISAQVHTQSEQQPMWQRIVNRLTSATLPMREDQRRGARSPEKKFLKNIGGKWGERFSVAHVSPSVVPTYFPTLRVYEYNITGLEDLVLAADIASFSGDATYQSARPENEGLEDSGNTEDIISNREKESRKKPRKYKFKVPKPPSKSAPPGPAYSPQPFTLTSYTQYFANLTHINNDFVEESVGEDGSDLLEGHKWKEGKHYGKKTKHSKPHPKKFKYEVEYSTTNDKVYKLKDLTVTSYLDLATKIGKGQEGKSLFTLEESEDGVGAGDSKVIIDASKPGKHKKKKKKKHHKKRRGNKVWYAFVKRAFVGTMDAGDIEEEFSEDWHDSELGGVEDMMEL